MHLAAIQVIPQRHTHDCAVACLAMVCRVSYERALMSFKRDDVCEQGASVRQLQAAARKLERKLTWTRKVDPEATGILWVRSETWSHDHVVVLKDEQIIDTDSTLWDYDVYLSVHKAKPTKLLTLEGE